MGKKRKKVWKITGINIFGRKVQRIKETKKDALKEKELLKKVKTKAIQIYQVVERASGKYPFPKKRKRKR